MHRKETSPNSVTNPPSVAQTMLKLERSRVGMAATKGRQLLCLRATDVRES